MAVWLLLIICASLCKILSINRNTGKIKKNDLQINPAVRVDPFRRSEPFNIGGDLGGRKVARDSEEGYRTLADGFDLAAQLSSAAPCLR
jgi:hypothetical protein